MRRWMQVIFAAAVVSLLAAGPAWAQDDDDREDYDRAAENYALGIGAGLVEPEGEVEPYLYAGFRIRMGDHDRSVEDLSRGGIQGFLEPEIGYWEHGGSSRQPGVQEDLLLGVNLLGVVAGSWADYWFGAGVGIHFQDFTRRDQSTLDLIDDSDEHVGLNAQFGVDVPISDSVGLFGAGRWDIVEGSTDEIQEKVYLGLRFGF